MNEKITIVNYITRETYQIYSLFIYDCVNVYVDDKVKVYKDDIDYMVRPSMYYVDS